MEQSRRVMSSRPARQGGGQWSSGLDALHYKIRHLDTTCPSASSDHSGLKEALHDRPPQSVNMPFGQSSWRNLAQLVFARPMCTKILVLDIKGRRKNANRRPILARPPPKCNLCNWKMEFWSRLSGVDPFTYTGWFF